MRFGDANFWKLCALASYFVLLLFILNVCFICIFFLLLVLLCFLFFIYGFYVLNKCSPKVPLPLTPFLFLACLSRRSTQEGNHFVQILVNGFSFSSSSKSNLLAGSFFSFSFLPNLHLFFSTLQIALFYLFVFFGSLGKYCHSYTPESVLIMII